jgi:hypothetical protein
MQAVHRSRSVSLGHIVLSTAYAPQPWPDTNRLAIALPNMRAANSFAGKFRGACNG